MYMHKFVGMLHEKKIPIRRLAIALDITEPTVRKYIKTHGFSLAQTMILADLLEIRNPDEICDIFLS